MKLGPLEIILIIVVVMFVLVTIRVVGAGRPALVKNAGKGTKSSLEIPQQQAGKSLIKVNQLKLAGVVLVLISILLLLSGKSMFKWALNMYLWSFILLAIGMAILFYSRKR